ncbi:MAG: hypothetical protein ABJA10_07470 [Aestuariivirga sp.]
MRFMVAADSLAQMLLPNRTRPWKITKDTELNTFTVRDASGKFIVNFVFYADAVSSLGYMTEAEAHEAAVAFARLSKE